MVTFRAIFRGSISILELRIDKTSVGMKEGLELHHDPPHPTLQHDIPEERERESPSLPPHHTQLPPSHSAQPSHTDSELNQQEHSTQGHRLQPGAQGWKEKTNRNQRGTHSDKY